jgi:hypothetical protein
MSADPFSAAQVAGDALKFLGVTRQRAARREQLRDLLNLIDRTDKEVAYGVGVGFDDARAFEAVGPPGPAQAHGQGWQEQPSRAMHDLNENYVLIGGPRSEPLTQLVFGYESGPKRMTYTGGLPVRYRWDCDISTRVPKDVFHRRPGGRETRTLNWSIVDERDGYHLWPATATNAWTGNKAFLASDYLLITRLPNFFTPDAYSLGRTIVSIGGTHGIGTRGISLLLKSAEYVQHLLSESSTPGSHFQVLYEIRDIEHHPDAGSRGRSIRLQDFESLRFTDDDIARARDSASRRYARWVADGERPFQPRHLDRSS